MEFATVPLWRGNHGRVRQEVEHFARYIYLPVRTVTGNAQILKFEDHGFEEE